MACLPAHLPVRPPAWPHCQHCCAAGTWHAAPGLLLPASPAILAIHLALCPPPWPFRHPFLVMCA